MGATYSTNKKAFHDYEIIEKFEAGVELIGSEAKAIRCARVNLKDSFVRIINLEAFAFEIHISHLATANPAFKSDEKRPKKLLLHKKEILKLEYRVKTEGLTLIPLSIYANQKNKIKIQIGLAKGKKLHDKRESLKERQANIETKRALKDY